ncbi:MAG: hypothetical protein K6G22_01310 [Lachnospiraceae bacterium]|nr:hypothetical protein [Lachnospiraceae bacterium]
MKMNKRKIGIIAGVLGVVIVGFVFAGLVGASTKDTEETNVTRGLAGKKGGDSEKDDSAALSDMSKPVEVYDGHLDTVIMIYMVGSNLESQNGLGTMDLHEIGDAYKKAGKSDQPVKFIVQTGGAKEWYPDFKIPADKSSRYEIVGEDLVLKQEFDLANMANPGTLADFIAWGMASYPADRYGLILWDHGGGTVLGFGADEVHSGSMMRIQQLKKAFETAGGHFDFIGFDACLMGTVETACMLKPFADYMIASEEMEPGNGWFYTNWVGMLLDDPKASVESFGTQIVDDFADSNEKAGDLYTLSLIDLSKIDDVYNKLVGFTEQSEKTLESDEYVTLSKARSDARSFGNGGYEQIDIIDFIEKSGVEDGDALKSSVNDAIIHFKTNMKGANGLAMYYPYDHLDQFTRMNQLLETLKFDQSYRDYFSGFCTVVAQSDDATKSGTGYSEEEWYKPEMSRAYQEEAEPEVEPMLPYKELGGYKVIDMSQELFDKMTYIGMEVWIDTGYGYMELGVDTNTEGKFYDSSQADPELLPYETEDTDACCIAADFDKTWLVIDGIFAPYYMQDMGYKILEDGNYVVYDYGYVPAVLSRKAKNGKPKLDEESIWLRIELISDPFDMDGEEKTTGSLTCRGYWVYDDMALEGGDSVRNLQQLEEGDEIAFVANLLYDDKDEPEVVLSQETIKVSKDGLDIGYAPLDDITTVICFNLRDVYKNEYFTDWVRVN